MEEQLQGSKKLSGKQKLKRTINILFGLLIVVILFTGIRIKGLKSDIEEVEQEKVKVEESAKAAQEEASRIFNEYKQTIFTEEALSNFLTGLGQNNEKVYTREEIYQLAKRLDEVDFEFKIDSKSYKIQDIGAKALNAELTASDYKCVNITRSSTNKIVGIEFTSK